MVNIQNAVNILSCSDYIFIFVQFQTYFGLHYVKQIIYTAASGLSTVLFIFLRILKGAINIFWILTG